MPEGIPHPMNALGIGLGLAMDAAAASAALGLSSGASARAAAIRVAVVFGGFQALMPALGYGATSLGGGLVERVAGIAPYLAAAVFFVLALKLVKEAFAAEEPADANTSWAALLPIGIATSIDALAIGAAVRLVGESLWPVCLAAGLVTAALSAAALLAGDALSRNAHSGKVLRLVGALILAGLGVQAALG
jgi:putative Mn2+ efflux pump MntP